jgi:hypothetical protein
MNKFKLLDTVATLNPISVERLTLVEPDYTSIESLPTGLVGTIVEVYTEGQKNQYLVEFSDTEGREYAMAVLESEELLLLQYKLTVA